MSYAGVTCWILESSNQSCPYNRVDRKKSLKVLKAFMANRETLIGEEVAWLKKNDVTCVLSDAVAIAW